MRRQVAGFTLVELMVSCLVLTIVFVGWLRICNFQAIRKEALRRLAIEKAAGYLDIMARPQTPIPDNETWWTVSFTNNAYWPPKAASPNLVYPMFLSSDPIGYTLRVRTRANVQADARWPNGKWAVIALYDRHGVTDAEAGRPFSTMSVFMQ